MKKLKLNVKPVGAGFHTRPIKENSGITLIALIITIIVMLILVGITINVALNGGLFTKASDASKQMQVEADRETLLSAVVAAIGYDGKVVIADIELPTGWTGSNGTYTSPKGNTFTVDENGKITGGNGEEVIATELLAELRIELQDKSVDEVIKSFDDPIVFNNSEIIYKEMLEYNSDQAYILVEYKGQLFHVFLDETYQYIESVDYSEVIDSNNYFTAILKKDKAIITGLTENGLADLAQNKKITIPKIIQGADGKNYEVSKIGMEMLYCNEDLETLEFENGIQLEEIGEDAFGGCINLPKITLPSSLRIIGNGAFSCCDNLAEVNLNQGLVTIEEYAFVDTQKLSSITIPQSVENIGYEAFKPDDSQYHLTIYLEGRAEEPATTGHYSEIGFDDDWRGVDKTLTTVVCLGN